MPKTFTDDEAVYMTQSATHHWLSSIAGRSNYEVTKTVTEDHAVQNAQSTTHQRMFVCEGLQHMDEYAEEKRTE